MTIIQYLWPCIIFLSLYIIRNRFQPIDVNECKIHNNDFHYLYSEYMFLFKGQFPTRQLPTKNQLLPFFQSYICSIENQCLDVNKYEEGPNYESAL